MTCFVSKPSIITLVELYIVNTSYQKLPFGYNFNFPGVLLLTTRYVLGSVGRKVVVRSSDYLKEKSSAAQTVFLARFQSGLGLGSGL